MNCDAVKDNISAAVDSRLESRIKKEFEAHLAECPPCRNEVELERLTKSYLQKNVFRSTTPSTVSSRILSQLSAFAERETQQSSMFRLWGLKPVFVVGAVAVLAIILFVSFPLNLRHLHTSPADNNIVHQSLNNFDAVLEGRLKPQVSSNDPAEVKTYFSKNINYEVKVPRIKKCELVGALVSNYGGKPLAHLMYKSNNQVVYLYQVDMQTVLEGKTLTLPPDARESLLRTGWFVETLDPKCSLVMWVIDHTLCTAVADMDKTELIASLLNSN